jgi:hypothetical protein
MPQFTEVGGLGRPVMGKQAGGGQRFGIAVKHGAQPVPHRLQPGPSQLAESAQTTLSDTVNCSYLLTKDEHCLCSV